LLLMDADAADSVAATMALSCKGVSAEFADREETSSCRLQALNAKVADTAMPARPRI
jgi:hypothetical protein